jgi:hypothetical protein
MILLTDTPQSGDQGTISYVAGTGQFRPVVSQNRCDSIKSSFGIDPMSAIYIIILNNKPNFGFISCYSLLQYYAMVKILSLKK